MTSWRMRAVIGAALALTASAAMAQQSDNLVASKTDWSVFADKNPVECWGVSPPKQSVNTRDGKPVSVKRSDILLFETFRPGQAGGEASYTGGYPFADGSTVGIDVDGTKFDMITQGEWAWAASPDDDAKLMAAMQKGQSASVTAHSAKGTQTVDTFSLRGFAAAMTEAASRCK